MKNLIIGVCILSTAVNSFCQQSAISNKDYMIKSNHQKTAAWILLGGGAALVAVSFIINGNGESSFNEAESVVIVGGAGILSILGSIPLFIASSRNKHKAVLVSFKNERTSQVLKGSMAGQYYPSLSFKIHL